MSSSMNLTKIYEQNPDYKSMGSGLPESEEAKVSRLSREDRLQQTIRTAIAEFKVSVIDQQEVIDTYYQLFKDNRFTISEKTAKSFVREFIRTHSETKNPELALSKGTSLVLDVKNRVLGIPFNMDKHADDAILMHVLLWANRLGTLEITGVPGDYEGIQNDVFNTFIGGYVSELLSHERVAGIHYAKDKPYQNGRACARYELLKCLTSAANQNNLRNIPKELSGEGKKLQPYLLSIVTTFVIEKERKNIFDLLKFMASLTSKETFTKDKFVQENFFINFDALLNKHKRTQKVEKKTKKGKITLDTSTLNPTKPSTLSTIFGFEKDAVKELYDSPFYKIEKLRKDFNDVKDILNADIAKFEKEIQESYNEQWRNKSFVLKITRVREVKVFNDKSDTVNVGKTIEATKSRYKEITVEDKYREYLYLTSGRIDWLPDRKPFENSSESATNFREFVTEHRSEFPSAYRLIEIEREITELLKQERLSKIVSIQKIDNNRFAALDETYVNSEENR
jgi:hypothetical protein